MNILIVDDDANLLEGLTRTLKQEGLNVKSAPDAEAALSVIADIDLLVSDLKLPNMNGVELAREARKIRPGLEVVIMTAFGTIPSAVDAMREGARGYLTKPFDTHELLIYITELQKLLKLKITAALAGRGDLVGSSHPMQAAYSEIDAAACSLAPVLITGETGTGKDLAARSIHEESSRRTAPFIDLNLGALPRDLVESELFGHEKGAFTGAHASRRGRFELAEGGSLFLDEIDSLPLDLQPKLLRAIEQKEIWRLGADKPYRSDARIISATNADVERLVSNGSFREDLYYRLNVLRVNMPALRQHPEDIVQITRMLLDKMATSLSCSHIDIEPEAVSILVTHSWKGNVRELANALERAVARASSLTKSSGYNAADPITIKADCLQASPADLPELPFKEARARVSDTWARNTVSLALSKCSGNVSDAARLLKMSRTALARLITRYNLR